VYIKGTLRTEKYTAKDGIERYSTEVVAKELILLGGGGGGGGNEVRQPSKPADDEDIPF
jgi:single-strand DNA-binding protein